MSRDELYTVESTAAGDDGVFTRVTGTDVTGPKRALDVFAQGGNITVTPAGLQNAGLISQITLGTAGWTALPATALTDRNSLAIQNISASAILVNFTNAVGVTIGWQINPNGEFFLDAPESIPIYARAVSGTPTITVMEIS